jgi:transposase-like protein
MRFTQSEKLEFIRIIEQSELSVNQTLKELGIHKSAFYLWYRRYREEGVDGLVPRPSTRRHYWNRIPDQIKTQVVDLALDTGGIVSAGTGVYDD